MNDCFYTHDDSGSRSTSGGAGEGPGLTIIFHVGYIGGTYRLANDDCNSQLYM